MRKIKLKVFGRIIGMTVTELLVVVVITGLLATMALPMFTKALEKAKVEEVANNLKLLAINEDFYWLLVDKGKYTNLITDLNMENPNSNLSRYFDYSITTPASRDDFEGKAVRRTGPYAGDVYTIHKDGSITGPLL